MGVQNKSNLFEKISMTGKQKIAVAIGVAFLSIAFVFLYRQFSMENQPVNIVLPPSMPIPPTLPVETMQGSGETVKSTPLTPDGVVDDIVESDGELSVLGDEETGETQAVEESVRIIDDLSNAYEEE